MLDKQFIPVNRKKMILMTLVYGVLGFTCFFGIYYWGEYQDWANPTIFKTASVIVLLFFMVVAGTFAKNLRKADAGLTIDPAGITDQSSNIGSGLIKWKEITGISKVKTPTSKLILITVKKPETFINNAPNGAVKRLLNQNLTIYKTPVVINAAALSTNVEELEQLLLQYANRFGKKIKHT